MKPEAGIRKEYSCFNFKFGYKVSFLNGMILVYKEMFEIVIAAKLNSGLRLSLASK